MKKNISIKIMRKTFYSELSLPSYATEGSAGLDLYASIEEETIFEPKEIKNIPTGIAIHIDDNTVAGFVFPRSGLSSKYGITLINSVGVIDSDYNGEIICPLINHSNTRYIVKPGDRIAQIVFMPIYTVDLILKDELNKTKRGSGGFGSTGR
jgi:dUTP pyrophosphatase